MADRSEGLADEDLGHDGLVAHILTPPFNAVNKHSS